MTLRLVFYLPALAGGGGERVLAVLASEMARRGHEVTMLVDFDAGENQSFLSQRVALQTLDRNHARSVIALSRALRRIQPDVVLTAIGGSCLKAILATPFSSRRRVVISYHGYLENEHRILGAAHIIGAALWTRISAAAVCVSDGLMRHLIDKWRAAPERCVRIFNPIMVGGVDLSLDAATFAAREPVVLAAGRLVEIKNFCFLVRAFARVAESSARLVILGEGPERAAIEATARELGVAGRVSLPGYVPTPWDWYSQARCFALTSHVEAFGNVVVEALAHGLPVVSTCCAGPEEILTDERLGAIVRHFDEAAFARAIDAALANPGDPAPRRARAADFPSRDRRTPMRRCSIG
jgi:glycosyltransferase involved in cell wall biosynthesis